MSLFKNLKSFDVEAVDFDPFADGEVLLTALATEAQKEIWVSVQLGDEANCAYNESVSLQFSGELNIQALEAALRSLVQRHEALRTTLSSDGKTLCILNALSLDLPVFDFSELDEEVKRSKVSDHLKHAVEEPFSLEHDPLFRATLIKLQPQEHLLILTAHHIICDGWSWGVMIPELGNFYSGLLQGELPTLDAAEHFSNYAQLLEDAVHSEETLETENYWLEQFANSVPIVDLPTDKPRPSFRTFNSCRIDKELDPIVVAGLKELGTAMGCSFMTTILSSFEIFLHRLTGQEDLVVGIPAAGQAATGMYNLVGHCVNLLPLRTRLDSEQTFSEYLQNRRSAVLDAYDHQQFTFGNLVQKLNLPRDSSRIPLVSVIFNIDQGLEGDQIPFAHLEVEFISNPRASENFELAVNLTEFKDRFILEWEYNTNLFTEQTACRHIEAFETLLSGIVKAPAQRIAELPFLPTADWQKIQKWNANKSDYPRNATIHELFEAQVQRSPDAVAVTFQHQALTYQELNQRANQLANYLKSRGVGPDHLVGICLKRSLEMAIAFLGILKAGAAYVPLDPDYPKDRLEFMVQDSQLQILLTSEDLKSVLSPSDISTVCLDSDWSAIEEASSENPHSEVSSENLAYVIYTSGSTGTPKGVLIEHKGLVNHCWAIAQEFELSERDRVLQFASISFDIAVEEIFPTWIRGATLVLRPDEVVASISDFLRFIDQEKITILDLPTTYWHTWMSQVELVDEALPDSVRLVVVGGEKASSIAYAAWKQVSGERCRWINTYGPTETTVTATLYDPITSVHQDISSDIPIGKPIANAEVYVLDRNRQPVIVGMPGELYIGGAGVARGYLNRPELTQERFVPDPFSNHDSAFLYRTGDLVRYLPDGNLTFLGRIDHQVKIRGFRVELGEIEAAMMQHPEVLQSVAIVKEESPEDKRLVGYVVAQSPSEDLINDLRRSLKQKLPEYMVPVGLVVLETLPLLPNGKVDLKALPAPDYSLSRASNEFVAPQTETEIQVSTIWVEILKLDRVSLNDNFFELGGHSLLAAQVIARLRKTFSVDISLRNLFEDPTVLGLAAQINNLQWAMKGSDVSDSQAIADEYEEGEL
jgi:amino acid adenylation domain-containing protein